MIYLVFHNQTDAMRCRSVLGANRIGGTVVKAPRGSGEGSCAWAVRIPADQRDRAGQICLVGNIHPCAWHSE